KAMFESFDGHHVGAYIQSDRVSKFVSNITQVRGGYCASACLDWCRRVLQGGRTSFEAKEDKHGRTRTTQEQEARERKQTERAANIHKQRKLGNINTALPWAEVGPVLDRDYTSGKSRKFAGINRIHDRTGLLFRDQQNYPSIPALVTYLTTYSTTGFTAGCCAILGFDFQNGQGQATTGHDIAVYMQNTSTFVLFDPNYNMWSFPNTDKLTRALVYLFDKIYPSGDEGHHDPG